MMGFSRIQTLLAVTISAALIGAAGSMAYDGRSALAGRAPASGPAPFATLAQPDDQLQMEQVGEGDTEDTETLDAGAPPAQDGEDIELLDQGTPPTAAAPPAETAAPAPAAVAAPPAEAAATAPSDSGAVYTAPTAPTATGPVLPPGFGSGRVRASAGRFGFPVGLESCHVGVITGRAYVGIDCDEEDGEGRDVVGHAPSFEDFPFVLEAEFPFESDDAFFSDPFFTGGDSADAGDGDVEASTRRSTRNNGNSENKSNRGSSRNASNSNSSENVVVTGIGSGNAAVELAQQRRERQPLVRAGKDRSNQTTKRQKARDDNASAAAASIEAKNRNTSENQQAAKADNGNKGKKSKDGKKKREKRRSGKND